MRYEHVVSADELLCIGDSARLLESSSPEKARELYRSFLEQSESRDGSAELESMKKRARDYLEAEEQAPRKEPVMEPIERHVRSSDDAADRLKEEYGLGMECAREGNENAAVSFFRAFVNEMDSTGLDGTGMEAMRRDAEEYLRDHSGTSDR